MPNHFHGIVNIEENPVASIHPPVVASIHELTLLLERDESPLKDKETHRLARRRMLLPLVVGYLKMNSAKRINIGLNGSGIPIWQRNYYERIVRNDQAYNAIRQYIRSNPTSWDTDEENR